MDVKQYIVNRLLATRRRNVEKVVDYMEKNSFFKKSCHHHHQYHGGLADHAWQTYQFALYLNNENLMQSHRLEFINKDSIAISAILHDICNCDGLSNLKGHGRRSVKILEELEFQLKTDEILSIRFHMGLHSKHAHRLYDKAKECQLLSIIHQADGMSAKVKKGCM